jgi:hypothetical protein
VNTVYSTTVVALAAPLLCLLLDVFKHIQIVIGRRFGKYMRSELSQNIQLE